MFKHGKPIPFSEGIIPDDPDIPPPKEALVEDESYPDLEEE